MGGRSAIVAISVCAALAAAAPAQAASITEFPLGGAPGAHVPRYIKAGPDGNLWFSDGGTSGGIGRISPTGELFAEIGGHFPDDLAFALDGTLFWAGDTGIGRREPDGAIVEHDVNTEVLAPYAVAVNYKGFLAWSEAMNEGTPTVCEGEAFTAEPLVQCGQPGGAPHGRITGLAFDREKKLWETLPEANTVRRREEFELNVELPTGSEPARIVEGPDGNMWVTMFKADAVDRITPTGARTRFHLSAGANPNDIAVGPDGALWVTEYAGDRIARITTSGEVTGEYPVPTPGAEPTGITAGPDGAIWFTELAAGKIGRLVPGGPGSGGAGSGGAGGQGAGAKGDTVPPAFTAAPAFHPRRFRTAGRGSRSTPKGSSLRLSLSEAATLKLQISAQRIGHKLHGKCVTRSRANRGKAPCRLYLRAGTLSVKASSGPNRLSFSGRVAGHALRPGTYRVSIVATDAAGNSSAPAVVTFTVAP